MIERRANEDFEWAVFKGFLRSVLSLITRRNNSLLSFDEVRARLPLKGQHSLGLRQVPIANIVGSMGRYNDFDRAFLPVQTRTKDRWVNISKAAYNDVSLPAIELYKIGEIYFVRDGNHRVSVARGRGQEFIDAFVTEIVVPVHLTADTRVDDLQLKQEYALFVEQTGLPGLRPGANLETALFRAVCTPARAYLCAPLVFGREAGSPCRLPKRCFHGTTRFTCPWCRASASTT